MDNDINILLNSLKNITTESKQLLNEASDITGRMIQLQSSLYGDINSAPYELSEQEKRIIDTVKHIRITYEHRILSYRNIHNERKYDIHANKNMGFILKSIFEHMDNPKTPFDPKEINEKAICETFKTLTKSSYENSVMDIDEFRYEYRSVAFGTFKKTMVKPNVLQLVRLYKRTPYIVSYINNQLIFDFIKSLDGHYKLVKDRFNILSEKHPNLDISLNSYLTCLETGLRNTLLIYKAIRSTFAELKIEYRNIFNEIIRLDKEYKSEDLNESVSKPYNSTFSDIDTLNKSIIKDELTSDKNTLNTETELSKSKSLIFELESKSLDNRINRSNTIDKIKNNYGIISKINNDDLKKMDESYRLYLNYYKTYPNIVNEIDMSNFMSKLETKVDFCKEQFYKLISDKELLNNISKMEILKSILMDTSFWEDIPGNESIDFLIQTINNKILNKPDIVKVDNLNPTFNNIINIPDYLDKINNHLYEMDKLIIYLYNETMKLNTEYIELVIKKVINTYIEYSSIISCIFNILLKFEIKSIELVQNLIDQIK